MTSLVVLPLWQVLLAVLGIAALTGCPSAYFGAKYGARLAVDLCSKQNGCAMRIRKEREQDTHDLEQQLIALRAAHPEIARAREAARAVLNDTGEHPTIPETKK